MTPDEYLALRMERPDLKLPVYGDLMPHSRRNVDMWDRETMIARRTYRMIGREMGSRDILNHDQRSDPL